MLVIGNGECHDGDRHVRVLCGNTGDAPISKGNKERFLEEVTVELSLHEAVRFSD